MRQLPSRLLLLSTFGMILSSQLWATVAPSNYAATFDATFTWVSAFSFPSGGDQGGGSASGWDFSFTTPTTLLSSTSFVTTGRYNPGSFYYYDLYNYGGTASFAPGGSFTLTGPGSEVFTASFLSASGAHYGQATDQACCGRAIGYDHEKLIATLVGSWSTGERDVIHLQMNADSRFGPSVVPEPAYYTTGQAVLNFVPLSSTPEPTSLLLLCSGIGGVVGFPRLFRRNYKSEEKQSC